MHIYPLGRIIDLVIGAFLPNYSYWDSYNDDE